MVHFIDDPLNVVSAKPDFSYLGFQDKIYLVGVSNPSFGIDKPVLAFKHLSNARDFVLSHPLKENCFYSISIIELL